jgi:hypothetical protein
MLDDVRLKTIADWIADKYDPDRRFVDRLVGECRAAALRYSAATRDAIAESRDELVRLEAASATSPVVKETPTQRAERRQKVLDPILANKHWTVNQWADEVNLPNSTTFRYYNGQTNPRPDTRDALATPLGIKSEDLPS